MGHLLTKKKKSYKSDYRVAFQKLVLVATNIMDSQNDH